jgi:hypothetical protein
MPAHLLPGSSLLQLIINAMREFRFSSVLQKGALILLAALIDSDNEFAVEAQQKGVYVLCSNLMSPANACCIHVHGEARMVSECLERKLVYAQKAAAMAQQKKKETRQKVHIFLSDTHAACFNHTPRRVNDVSVDIPILFL